MTFRFSNRTAFIELKIAYLLLVLLSDCLALVQNYDAFIIYTVVLC